MTFPAASAHRVAAHVDVADAALVEPAAVALRAVRRLAPPPGDRVLIVGAGAQGYLAAAILAQQGDSDVAVLDRRPERVERLRALGVREPEDGETFGRVLEAAGGVGSLDEARSRLAPGGRLVVVGLSGQATVPVAVDELVTKDQTMAGSVGSPGVWPEVIAMVESGALQPSALVTHVVDLTEFDEAQALLRGADPTVGKVLIAPNSH